MEAEEERKRRETQAESEAIVTGRVLFVLCWSSRMLWCPRIRYFCVQFLTSLASDMSYRSN